MKMLRVQDLMTVRPTTVSQETRLLRVLDLMVQGRFQHVPVINEEGLLMGIVSDHDLRTALPDRSCPRREFEEAVHRLTADDVMTREPLTVLPDCPLPDAIALMLSCQVGALPVVERGYIVGILTQSDILRRYAEELSQRDDHEPQTSEETSELDTSDFGPPRVFVLCPDARIRAMLTSPLSDAGLRVQGFDSLPEMMAVWHLMPPDLFIVDRSVQSNPNLRLLMRSQAPLLWLDHGLDSTVLSGETVGPLELPCGDLRLIRAIRVAIGEVRASTDLAQSTSGPIRVLLAEDDHVIRRILQHHLTAHGYELTEANDGREAQEFLDSRSFDIVLLDINMPHVSGLTVLRGLKNHPEPPKRVVLSASHREETVMQAFALGADDFVRKPFNPEVLLRRLDQLVQRA